MPDPDLIFGLTKAMIPDTPRPNAGNQPAGSTREDPNDPKNKPDEGKDKTGTAARTASGFANSIEKMVEKKLIELLVKLVEPGAFVGATGPVQAGPGLIQLLATKIGNMALAELPAPPEIPSKESVPSQNRPTPPFPEDIKNQIIEEAASRTNS